MSFDPVTLTILATVAGLAGTAVTTYSAIQQDNYQAQVATRQAATDRENAARAEDVAQINQQNQDNATAAMIGQETALQGASGLSIGGRSQILTRKSAAELGRQDALRIRQAGDLESYNDLVHSQASMDAANAAHTAAGTDLVAGFLGGAGTLIGGFKDYLKVRTPSITSYPTVAVPQASLFGGP